MKKSIKSLYQKIPFKKEVFHFVKRFYTPKFYKSLQFKGSFPVEVEVGKSFNINHNYHYGIETELFWKGIKNGWETESLYLWMMLCKNAKVILDIGAHEGLYSLVSRSLNPVAQIKAFEPLPSVYDALKNNIDLNNYQIECLNVAISDFDGESTFFSNGDEHSTESSLKKEHINSTNIHEINVKVMRLDSYIKSLHLHQIDLMKIDVEGAEPEVLRGMGSYLKLFKPSMLIEILNDKVAKEIEELVEGLGYIYFDINDDIRNGVKGYKRVSSLSKSTCLNYLLVQPEKLNELGINLTTDEFSQSFL